VKLPRSYLDRAQRGESFGSIDPVATAQLPFEFMLNALRMNDGIAIADFADRTGLPRDAIDEALGRALAQGWIDPDDAWLRPSERGRRFLNDLVGLFLVE
jgi:oxygen-independent coproporphyrinogen-3 oxidase